MDGPSPQLQNLSRETCMELLGGSVVGRVAVSARALPAVFPVNYALRGSQIVFRTAADGVLARACDQSVVGFEIDELASDGRSGWSVLVVGLARLLDGSEALRANELNLISAPDGGRNQFVAISLGQISGRVIAGPDPANVPAD